MIQYQTDLNEFTFFMENEIYKDRILPALIERGISSNQMRLFSENYVENKDIFRDLLYAALTSREEIKRISNFYHAELISQKEIQRDRYSFYVKTSTYIGLLFNALISILSIKIKK